MNELLILSSVMVTSFLLFLTLFRLVVPSENRLNKRMKHYLQLEDEKSVERPRFQPMERIRQYKERISFKLAKRKNNKLEVMLHHAGLPLKPEEFVSFQILAIVLLGALLYLLSGQWLFLFVGAVLGWMIPKWWVKKKQRARITAFNEQLPDMLTTVVGSLRSGMSFSQSLTTVIEEADSPMREEMSILIKEMQYGSTMEAALSGLKERMPSEDLELMIQAILIQRQVGGNLAIVLDKIVETIRDRNKIQRNILTLTAQGRLSGLVIGLMPVILGFVLYLIQPEYIGALFTTSIGIIMLAAGAVSCTIGFILIRKLTKIEV
ncbi:MAG TPA: type II secretion system F family protein [Bacillales bacterium]|nr:type II secretion system F family protein [Bacillales bacterium]